MRSIIQRLLSAQCVSLGIVLPAVLLVSGEAIGASGWTVSTQIVELNQQPATGVAAALVFVETALTSDPSGCSHPGGFYFAVNDERQKRMFSMLLAAQVSGRNVKIFTNGSCHGQWGYAEIDGLVIN